MEKQSISTYTEISWQDGQGPLHKIVVDFMEAIIILYNIVFVSMDFVAIHLCPNPNSATY